MTHTEKIKDIRARTGLGILEVSNALKRANGIVEFAIHDLRQHSASQVVDRGHKPTHEGVIASYVHQGSKVGVLLEVNCETDFVARNEEFRRFVSDLALHIVAAAPKCISRKEIPYNIVLEERSIAMEHAKDLSTEAATRYINGHLEKFYTTTCLLDQPMIKNTDRTIQELLIEFGAKFKELIVIKRFARYQLGQ